MKLTLVIAAALFAPTAALANPAASPQPQAQPQAVTAEAPAPAPAAATEALVCRTDRSGGSRSAAKKTCLTQAEWAKRRGTKADSYRRGGDNSFR